MEIQKLEVGQAVIFVDAYAVEHDALLTAVWGEPSVVTRDGKEIVWFPAVNLVYVTKDEAKRDPYGRQIERNSSIAHQGTSTAHGNFYKLK